MLLAASKTTARGDGVSAPAPYTTWREYGGSPDDAQYSALKQINPSNVARLQQVWFYPAGNNGGRYGSNPIVIQGVMYVIGKNNSVTALDAATGKEIWVHDFGKVTRLSTRGLTYWQNAEGSDRRILCMVDNTLTAIDARSGKTIGSFGDNGSVDLRVGLGRDPSTIRMIGSQTPGRIFGDLILEGSATGEEYESPPGDLRAYNVITGQMAWIFHTVPHPGEPGYETWPPDAWKYIGGTNTWGEISLDAQRGIAYFPTGSPTYDFYGADRNGANLYSDCLLAIDARTGKLLWYYQTTHHDLWDYDLTVGPKLLTVNHDGHKVDILAEASKNGFVYVLNRETGKPLWPIVERPVPQSDMPGQIAWPTQPFPTVIQPFDRQQFAPDDVDPYIADPKEREAIRAEIAATHNDGLYTPDDTRQTMEMPGNNGGANWGSAAADPTRGLFFVLSKAAPSILQLEPKPPRREINGSAETKGQVVYLANCRMCHMANMAGQPPAIPSLTGVVDRVGENQVRTVVQGGLGSMPAVSGLEPSDLDNLIAYLRHPEQAHVPPNVLAYIMAPNPTTPRLAPPGTRYWSGYGFINSSEGLPTIGPPWSTLTAYDLNTGIIKWQVPFGGVTWLEEKGITDTGSFWPRGGVVVTASGLIFGGAKSDGTVRAYDEMTGKVLWQAKIAADPEGIPAVYEVAGREYLVMSATQRPNETTLPRTAGSVPAQSNDEEPPTQGYYVFALPEGAGESN